MDVIFSARGVISSGGVSGSCRICSVIENSKIHWNDSRGFCVQYVCNGWYSKVNGFEQIKER